ncbi:MAG TPA: MOSC domain-containing protein [Chloroflexota bacterium]|nr:MOSC domain-containing protein [Chloroflexota bacterium]
MTQTDRIEIVSVNVARPAVLAVWPTKDVISAIAKRPVAAPTLRLSAINVEGDEQADTRPDAFGAQVHGGPDQAIYVYPFEHYPDFERELGRPVECGLLGENLTIRGATEGDVCIGDVWAWGEALVQVSAPRLPCFKLGIRLGKHAMRKWIRDEGKTGWYLRVLRTGTIPTTGSIEVVERHPAGVTVLDVHQALQSSGAGPPGLTELEPLQGKIRRMLKVLNRDLTWGFPERDD